MGNANFAPCVAKTPFGLLKLHVLLVSKRRARSLARCVCASAIKELMGCDALSPCIYFSLWPKSTRSTTRRFKLGGWMRGKIRVGFFFRSAPECAWISKARKLSLPTWPLLKGGNGIYDACKLGQHSFHPEASYVCGSNIILINIGFDDSTHCFLHFLKPIL